MRANAPGGRISPLTVSCMPTVRWGWILWAARRRKMRKGASAAWNWPMAVRCFWKKSSIWPLSCNPRYCRSSSKGYLPGLRPGVWCRWILKSLLPPRSIWAIWWSKTALAVSFIMLCAPLRSSSRPCGNVATAFLPWYKAVCAGWSDDFPHGLG